MIQYGNLLYRLDIDGKVSIHIGGQKGFKQVMKQCTDIFVTDTVYAKQFSVNN